MKNYDEKNVIIENKAMANFLKYTVEENIKNEKINLQKINSSKVPLIYPKEDIARIQKINFLLNDAIDEKTMVDFLVEFKDLTQRDICLENLTYGLDAKDDLKLSNAKYILNDVPKDIKELNLVNLSLKSLNTNYFRNKNSLNELIIDGCTNVDLRLLKNTNFNTKIEIKNCTELTDSKNFLKWAISTPNPVKTDNREMNELIKLFKPNQFKESNTPNISKNLHKIDLSTFIKYIHFINENADKIFAKKLPSVTNNLYINIDEKVDFNKQCIINRYGTSLSLKASVNNKSVVLVGSPEDCSRILETSLNAKSMLIVDRIKDVSISEFKKLNTTHVSLNSRYGDGYQKVFYKMDDMTMIKKRVDQIEKKVKPALLKNISQKELFTRLYLELGKTLNFDYEVANEVHNGYRHERLNGSQNLKNGLLLNLSVCAGISDIVEKICADLNIEADIISTVGKDAHAWNRVKLDGNYYFVDLTWDLKDIKANNFPLKNFLKSKEDFGHKMYIDEPDRFDSGFDINKSQCYTTLKDNEQIKLLETASQPLSSQIKRRIKETSMPKHSNKLNDLLKNTDQNNESNKSKNEEKDFFDKF